LFVCVGQGYRIVNVSWHRRGRNNIPGRSSVTTAVTPDVITSTLTIPDLRNGNDGENYVCRYSNSEGETFSNFATLTVGCK